ncbi:MAG: DUF5696 domain-containing protein [Faecalibacterium sp.]|nr:DUF5696 domain-containing protein [Ruminococcus sp.]MCM1392982.1 DUF5696 domain-containing protein [Ruminococcus sp.]MCM1486524.1 DUF5696 domain-containing protein [Faecalibacterium sp.]
MLKIKRGACILLLLCMLFTFFGCSGRMSANVDATKISDTKQQVAAENKSKSVYVCAKNAKQMKKIAVSDSTVLYFDESTYNVSVYDSIGKKLWNSLPEKYTNGKPAVVNVDIVADGNVYTLNSQDDSVAQKNASYKTADNGLIVTYGFKKTLGDGANISFNIPVQFSVDSGTLSVSVDCSKIKNDDMSENVIVKTIHLLEYFGANTVADSGDYILIPDGSGAAIDIGDKTDKFDKITLPVYGADYSVGENDSLSSAYVASFGMKSGDNAYVALIESGDATAKITAEKALTKGAYNRVGAQFDVTKVVNDNENKMSYASGKSYDGEFKISYRLLSGDNSDYIGMASACREMLIRNGTLSFGGSYDSENVMPFVLSLVGAAEIGDEKPKMTALTTFEQAEDVLSFFRGKGVNNIYLRYRGMFDGGLRQTSASKTDISSNLGSKSSFEEFISYTDLQNITVFADMNLISAKSGSLKNAATAINSTASTHVFSDLKGSAVKSTGERELLAVGDIEKTMNSAIYKMRRYAFDGICTADAGSVLYSDFSSGSDAVRQQMKDAVSAQINAISSSKKLMVSAGNIYSMKYADMAVCLPTSAACASRDYCSSVPFLQALLHGVVNYSCEPINLTSNSETAMLKAAEFGCVPNYELYYEDFGTDETADNYHYMNYASDVQLCYERMSSVFSDLGDKKITAHYRVKKGVYCTEYGGSTSVYVNYNKKDVTVGGVTVEARDFLRVN